VPIENVRAMPYREFQLEIVGKFGSLPAFVVWRLLLSVGESRCKPCGVSDYVKSGTVRGHHRYRCHGCGCHFTDTPARGKPAAMKALAVLLYGMGNMIQHDRAPAGGQRRRRAEVGVGRGVQFA